MSAAISWPDTRGDIPPTGHPYLAAIWLLGRHPQLARLTERAGVVTVDEDGPFLDVDALAERVTALDADRAGWAEYQRRHPPPRDDARYDAWEAAGPARNPAAEGVGGMSRTEVSRLRLLATLSTTAVPFRVSDLAGLDAAGQQLLADWCHAIQTA